MAIRTFRIMIVSVWRGAEDEEEVVENWLNTPPHNPEFGRSSRLPIGTVPA
jgi:hypothetical protein